MVLGPLEWSALLEAGELDGAYPDDPSIDDYGTYLETCRAVTERTDCDLVSVQRALWRLAGDS